MGRAGEIGGLAVSSTSPFFLALLGVHVAAALTAVVTGLVVALRRDKGSSAHVKIGHAYVTALALTAITALVLATFAPRRDAVLAVLAVLATGAAGWGVWHRRRKRPGDRGHIVAMGTSYTLMLIAFYVDNGKSLPVWRSLPTAFYWLIPGVIGAVVTARAARRRRTHP